MSASLVGSEMCIRDRHWGCDLLGVGLHLVALGILALTLLLRSTGSMPHTCLLYTSDAADDM
eukprot:9575742-Alexandrium_andersonii.AAC.1